MTSFVDTTQILAVGYEMSGNATAAAAGILLVTAPIAFGLAIVRHATGARHPFSVIFQIAAVSFGLRYYGTITGTVAQIGSQAATTIGNGGKFRQLLDRYASDADMQFKSRPNAPSQSPVGNALDLVTAFGAGILSGLLSVVGMLAVLVALNLYQILQAVLYGVLVAVGPVIMAVCIIPGAQSLFGKWLSALFELAMWPVVGSIIFEMIGASLLKLNDTATTAGSENFVAQFVANIAMVFCVCLVPKIASRLVGSGFGALGDMMMSAATPPVLATAGAAASTGGIAAIKGLEAVGNASSQLVNAANASRLYQPPPSGGASQDFGPGPSLADREGALGPSRVGAESFGADDAASNPNLMHFDRDVGRAPQLSPQLSSPRQPVPGPPAAKGGEQHRLRLSEQGVGAVPNQEGRSEMRRSGKVQR